MESPGPTPLAASDDAASRAIVRMQWRIRLLRGARAAIELALYGAAFAILVLLAAKTGRLPEHTARRLLLAAVAFPLTGVAFGLARRVPALLAAQLLDRAYDLKDRLANALEFRALAPAARTPMMLAALDDAAVQARAHTLRASRALAWRWPQETAYAAAMMAVMAAVAMIEFRARQVIARPAPVLITRDPMLLNDDDVEAFREFSRQLEQRATTEETRQAVDRFNQFINQLSDQQLDRQDAFRRLQALQDELERGRENDRDALRDALREVGNRMERTETTRPLQQALQQSDPRAAAEAMHQLAEQLRQNQLSPQQRQDLQHALQRATQQQNREELQQQLQRAREEVERLLRQQRERQLSESEQRNLHQRQRDLERLQREQDHHEAQRRQLQRLDRAMSQAMQDLARELQQQAGADMEHGAEDLNRMHNQQMSEEQIAELRQQLEDLRQRMRQQNGQGGEQQRRQLERFSGQARGGVMPGGMQPGGNGGQRRLTLGHGSGGGGMSLPGGRGQGTPGAGGGGDPRQPGGVEAGVGHDEHIRGAATSLQANLRTVNVGGQQTGTGPTRSQVIRTAAQEGFTGQRYRDVHAEYWQHAREIVHAGEVPPGYRSYVRRYFQLIRPRDGE